MKKIIAIVLCMVILLCTFGVIPTFNAAETINSKVGASSGITGTCTWELNDDGLLTIRANERIDDGTDETYGRIDDYSDISYNHMPPWISRTTKVIIEEGVTSIGAFAFYECKKIPSINIPDSVTNIGYHAFYCCYNLTNVTIGNNVTDIASEAFYDCTSLKSVTIPNNVARINIRAFGYYYDYDLQTTCKIDSFTIYGNTGSVAEKYAKANDFIFISVPDNTDPTTSEPTTEPSTKPIFGDIDGDGQVTVSDATLIQQYAAQMDTPYPIGEPIG